VTDAAVVAPEAPELRAAGLAALAEAGIVYLPAHLVLTDAAELEIGIRAGIVPFVVAYVTAVLLACRFRGSANVTTAAAVGAVLAGIALGGADLESTVLAVLVTMMVTLRAVSLGLRDWREPIHAQIGVGALVLGIEAMLAAGALPPWRVPLLVFVPTFFLGALASRATTVWAHVDGGHEEGVRGSATRQAAVATIALGGVMAGAAILAVRGGLFERVGAWLSPVANVVISVFASIVVVVLLPLFWMLDRIGIDPEALQELLEEWRRRAEVNRAVETVARADAPWWNRVVPLLILVGIGWLLYRSLRRLRPDLGAFERTNAHEGEARIAALADGPRSIRFLPRRSPPPADVVRRWYAQVLMSLDERGMRKEPSLTPSEFLPQVVEAFPDVERGFVRLTRMYEDVRYGNRHVSGDLVHDAEPEIRQVLATLRRPT